MPGILGFGRGWLRGQSRRSARDDCLGVKEPGRRSILSRSWGSASRSSRVVPGGEENQPRLDGQLRRPEKDDSLGVKESRWRSTVLSLSWGSALSRGKADPEDAQYKAKRSRDGKEASMAKDFQNLVPSASNMARWQDMSTIDTLPEFCPGSESDEDDRLHSDSDHGNETTDTHMDLVDPEDVTAQVNKAISRGSHALDMSKRRFEIVRSLAEAPSNYGLIMLVRDLENGGGFAVAKTLPNIWVMSTPEEFKLANPRARELPWQANGVSHFLAEKNFPYMCEPVGTFRDEVSTYFISSFAAGGDLVNFLGCLSLPGPRREQRVRQVMAQAFSAVRHLHNLGLAHRDLSLENFVLTSTHNPQVKLIDFGMVSLTRRCKGELRGKPPYVAPEMHLGGEYDAFRADAFSLGVLLYALALGVLPWSSTTLRGSMSFCYASKRGLKRLMRQRWTTCADGSKKSLVDACSPSLLRLIQGLLAMRPSDRTTLGEVCFTKATPRLPSAWEEDWLQDTTSSSREQV